MERWSELEEVEGLGKQASLQFEQALVAAREYVAEVASALSSDVLALLPEFDRGEGFQASRVIVDQLDALYSDLEEAGDQAASGRAFAAARFASACELLRRATSSDDVLNAVYKARHALLAN
jgi:hypothetical protein